MMTQHLAWPGYGHGKEASVMEGQGSGRAEQPLASLRQVG